MVSPRALPTRRGKEEGHVGTCAAQMLQEICSHVIRDMKTTIVQGTFHGKPQLFNCGPSCPPSPPPRGTGYPTMIFFALNGAVLALTNTKLQHIIRYVTNSEWEGW